MGLKPPN